MSKPKMLSRSGDLNKNWNEYKESFKSYLKDSNIKESDNKKAGTRFVDTIGPYGIEIAIELKLLNSTKDNIVSGISLKDIYQQFDNHCQSNSKLALYRYRFFTAKQGQDSSFDDFLSSLEIISKHCKFGDLLDSLLMIQIISGVSDVHLRDYLVSVIKDLDLEKTKLECGQWKKSQEETSGAKKPALIDPNDELPKNNDANLPVISSTSRKRSSTEKSKTDLEETIPESSCSKIKIPRQTISDEKSNDVSATESKPAHENKNKHKSEKNDYSTDESENDLEESKTSKKIKVKDNIFCNFCRNYHRYRDCPMYLPKCQLCYRRGHDAKFCYNRYK